MCAKMNMLLDPPFQCQMESWSTECSPERMDKETAGGEVPKNILLLAVLVSRCTLPFCCPATIIL